MKLKKKNSSRVIIIIIYARRSYSPPLLYALRRSPTPPLDPLSYAMLMVRKHKARARALLLIKEYMVFVCAHVVHMRRENAFWSFTGKTS